MVLVYGFIEEPRLLLHVGGVGQNTKARPSVVTQQLLRSLPGLLVAAMVGLHENNKVKLEQADHFFKVCVCVDVLTPMMLLHLPLGPLTDLKRPVATCMTAAFLLCFGWS